MGEPAWLKLSLKIAVIQIGPEKDKGNFVSGWPSLVEDTCGCRRRRSSTNPSGKVKVYRTYMRTINQRGSEFGSIVGDASKFFVLLRFEDWKWTKRSLNRWRHLDCGAGAMWDIVHSIFGLAPPSSAFFRRQGWRQHPWDSISNWRGHLLESALLYWLWLVRSVPFCRWLRQVTFQVTAAMTMAITEHTNATTTPIKLIRSLLDNARSLIMHISTLEDAIKGKR